jgi:hypothetical protein
LLVGILIGLQCKHGYKAWLYPSAAMRRVTSLDETTAFSSAVGWLGGASVVDIAVVAAPLLLAIWALVAARTMPKAKDGKSSAPTWITAGVFAAVLALSFFSVRWSIVASLLTLPLIWSHASSSSGRLRGVVMAFAALVLGLLAWGNLAPSSLRRPAGPVTPSPTDLDALLYRHFSSWFASPNPGQKTCVLAPPELSDSLLFHAGCPVLMSTAWQSYLGQVAASRVLSAPEDTEAEAVLQSREITHLVLPSWDKVLPLLVREPKEEGRSTLYARLQRWVYPLYLRPMPYHLPAVPGYVGQKLVVFKVVPPQDEALSLSRLAEYFVEMDRDEPAALAAKALAESFPDDPNAAIARAFVYAHTRRQSELDREVTRIKADVAAGRTPSSWDRRVQRAIILALADRSDQARQEIEACVRSADRDSLFDLTPLQAYRVTALAKDFGVDFADPKLGELAAALGAEYTAAPSPGSGR